MDRQRAIIGYLLVAAGSAMFSSKAIFIKLAYLERPDPLLMLAWRMAFALPVFLLVGAVEVFRRRKDGRPMPGPGAILGAVAVGLVGYYLAMILDFWGLLYVSAQLERLALAGDVAVLNQHATLGCEYRLSRNFEIIQNQHGGVGVS